ncbi:metal-dependent phosphohydrolase [Thermotoga maritima MSB8]|uniref:Uncharacterized protein n=1 Tax=Thermotoga maritima (strain ATCC 43589 / DSM 3109 / JCM 10099 / NBRC 100826 / MSB8) TaxID=243274 RepID=Q9X0N1_THEMA|nr:two-component system response regulator [Thermotoga maritima]AAD36223.1 conserved hypothetical protein [Thermotoga maritima MSB8]AGL50078.1 hypothetical protein Tmari_1154 [Thermotoga maritima MSB8]AHD18945.1 metal-dependent phosphohydrolase [Thermotoga maritima MSB8]AKE27058.1 metal-dependent phosphohydrolase [Thermotoga maritima]AKE28923.1 metal-dependent phosphohydrolase [Thermotoga maritima MSB8]
MRLLLYTEDSSVEWIKPLLTQIGVEIVECEHGDINGKLQDVDGVFLVLNTVTDEIVEKIKSVRRKTDRFVLVAVPHNEDWFEALEDAGVDDLIFRPINPSELVSVIEHMFRTRKFYETKTSHKRTREESWMNIIKSQQKEIVEYVRREESYIRERDKLRRENRELLEELYTLLLRVIELKDYETHEHTLRVGRISALVAEAMGCSSEFVELIEKAAPFHDIGKVFIPESILLKRGKLTSDEYEIMKLHTIFGYELLKTSKNPVLSLAAEVALFHHEKYNGKGYPHGLKGDEIPLSAQIAAVADSFDAMVSHRPYKIRKSFDEAIREIKDLSGRFYSPFVVKAFVQTIDEIRKLYNWGTKGDDIISNSSHHRKGGTKDGESQSQKSYC